MLRDRHGLEVLSREECLELLGSVAVGRVGLSVEALPVIVPVNFVLDGERIVIGTGAGGKLDAALAGVVIAFETDSWDPISHTGWSVLVRGAASVIDDPDDVRYARRLPLAPWGRPADLRYVTVTTDLVSGRRLRQAPGERAVAPDHNGQAVVNAPSGPEPNHRTSG
jgi:uncharacterized protein